MLDVVRHAQVQLGSALLVLVVCLGAMAWRNLFGRPLAPDVVVPEWLKGRSLSAALRARVARVTDLGLAGIAVALALLAMTAPRLDGTGLDRAQLLHETIQAKYHAELGWDGLYACAWAADRDAAAKVRGYDEVRRLELGPPPALTPRPEPELELQWSGDRLRRVRADKLERAAVVALVPAGGELMASGSAAKRLDCEQRFDEARWAALGTDVETLANMWRKGQDDGRNKDARTLRLREVFQGFGSASTPSRLARQRLVFAVLPFSAGSLMLLSILGGALVLAALALAAKAYGLRAAALVGILCFVEFAASPVASGANVSGALVLAAVLAGFSAAELDRWGLAGALLGFAAVELVWPTVVVLALLVKLIVDRVAERERAETIERQLMHLALGAIAAAAVALLISATLPGSFSNWSTWADRVAVHRYMDGRREVGLRWLFSPDGSWLGGNRAIDYPARAQLQADRQGWLRLCAALLSAPALIAVRRLPPLAFAAIAGVTVSFAFGSITASSGSLAIPLLGLAAAAAARQDADSALLRGRPTTVLVAGCLALCIGMHGILRVQPYEPWVFNMVYSHMLTTVLLGLGVGLLVAPGLRERGDPRAAPASIPVLDPGKRASKRAKDAGGES